jgi:L-alanine-DL-glutamate epimerase-like enolase superfamily enzyme
VRIRSVEAIPLDVRFKETFSFGSTDRDRSPNVILRMTTDEGIVGYGEACPIPAFTGETQESVVASIEGRLKDLLVGRDPLQHEPIIRDLERVLFRSPFTLAAIDVALWDVAGKILGVPVSVLLGGRFRERVEQHGSVGLGTAESMSNTALEQVEQGYSTLKLYAGRDALQEDLGRLGSVRQAVGRDIAFILDVNGRWDVTTCLRAMPVLEELGVMLLEQPIAAWDDRGQAEVVSLSTIEVMADEAVFGPSDVARIGRERTARVINLGLSKLGGLLGARECATVAQSSGLKIAVGSVLELGVASAAGLHLSASLPELAAPSYLMGPLKYERQITTIPLEVRSGEMEVPSRPGLGIEVDEEFLDAADSRR